MDTEPQQFKQDKMSDQPKPTTGEWTPQMVADIVEARKDVSVCVSVADAHNAALAAERELRERITLSWTLSKSDNEQLRSQLSAAQAFIEQCKNAMTGTGSWSLGDTEHTALAAAFKRGKLEGVFASPDEGEINYVRGLEQQLAAEREKHIPDKCRVCGMPELRCNNHRSQANRPTYQQLSEQLAAAQAAIKDVLTHDFGSLDTRKHLLKIDTAALDAAIKESYEKGRQDERNSINAK